jgi:hypothetical protein
VPLRSAQIAWLNRRARYGERCFVAVRRKTASDHDWLYLMEGGTATWSMMNKENFYTSQYLLGVFSGGSEGWDWEAIEEILREA